MFEISLILAILACFPGQGEGKTTTFFSHSACAKPENLDTATKLIGPQSLLQCASLCNDQKCGAVLFRDGQGGTGTCATVPKEKLLPATTSCEDVTAVVKIWEILFHPTCPKASKSVYKYSETRMFSPTVPFKAAIPGGVCAGSVIQINARMFTGASSIVFKLLCGPKEQNKIALGFSSNVLGMTLMVGSKSKMEFPFVDGEMFEIKVLATDTGFKIFVNGKDFITTLHLQPVEKIEFLKLSGDMENVSLKFD